MKTPLILALFLIGSAWAVEKKNEIRQGTKAVDEKYLESITRGDTSRKPSQDVHANQNRTQQLEAKKARQYQEEPPVTYPHPFQKRDEKR